MATAEYVRRSHAGARVLLVAERGSERQFAGCQLVAGPPADLVVVGGPDDSWTLSLLDDALRALQGGARLIAMQGNAWWLAADGARLDSGSYVRALAHAAGVRPRVIGKPAGRDLPHAPAARSACLRPPASWSATTCARTCWPRSARACAACSCAPARALSFADDPRAAQAAAILDSVADVPRWLEAPRRGA